MDRADLLSGWEVIRHRDAKSFKRRAGLWLLESEAEHNLLLGLLERIESGLHTFELPIYLATMERADGTLGGCAFRTPPYKVGLTRLEAGAIGPLAADLADVFPEIPGVMGPEAEAHDFANAWADDHGLVAQLGMRQCIYQLEDVIPPTRETSGWMIPAAGRHLGMVASWASGFSEDTGVATGPREQQSRWIDEGRLFLWLDGDPVCMAGVSDRTPNGARVGYVYTPPQRRGKGYASALVASLSQRLLDEGCSRCFLYTDRSNPTSNAIYQRVGYRPVCEVVDYSFASGTG